MRERAQRLGRPRHHSPSRRCLPDRHRGRIDLHIVLHDDHQPGVVAEIGDERRRLQIAVGDVERDDAAGIELLQVQLQRLARQR